MPAPAHFGPKKMTSKDNAQAAFLVVNTGVLDKLDAAFIARTTGVPVDQVQAMIDVRRDRERGHG